MNLNRTALEILISILVSLRIYAWMRHGGAIQRWWAELWKKRRGRRYPKPKSPEVCPQCRACRHRQTSRTDTPVKGLKTPLERVRLVVTSLAEGLDLSAAGRIFGHHPITIAPWVEQRGAHGAYGCTSRDCSGSSGGAGPARRTGGAGPE